MTHVTKLKMKTQTENYRKRRKALAFKQGLYALPSADDTGFAS